MDINEIQDRLDKIRDTIAKVVIGLDDVVEMLIISMISGGHILLEGPPGLGKTTLARTFAQTLGGVFNRIQMTPDLLPADVLGVNIYNLQDSTWSLRKGPIFANVILIDEINRASPRVQSAFLEVMQEKQVTIEGETLVLDNPFMVVATQIPLGEQGTYPLTSVQLDRFAYRVLLDSPSADLELKIVQGIDEIESAEVSPVLNSDDICNLMKQAQLVNVNDEVHRYIVDLVQAVRRNNFVQSGPSTRASIWLLKGARVKAMMDGRDYVIPDDVKALVSNVVSHRVALTPQARGSEVTVSSVLDEVLSSTHVPKGF